MAQHSKYSDGQVNAIINDMISVLETHKAPVDLSLIALGNMASNLLTTSVPAAQREALSQAAFAMYLNIGKNQVSEWERGIKKPSGAALKLLTIVKNKGIEAIA